MNKPFIPVTGDKVKIVGFHNRDAHSVHPDQYIDKIYTVLNDSPINSFEPDTFGFETVEGPVFFTAFVEPVID